MIKSLFTRKPPLKDKESCLPSRLEIPLEFETAPKPIESVNIKDPVALGIYYHELGLIELATYYFSISASKGNLDGLFFYAISLRHGWGIPQNLSEALRLLLLVVQMAQTQLQDNATPQYLASSLNKRFSRGPNQSLSGFSSLERNPNSANVFSTTGQRTALSGLRLAIFELSMCFRQGWGVAKDEQAATYYLNIAAELGDVDAQMEMGEAYLRGDGVKPNKRMAAQWFRKADQQGARMLQMHWIWKSKYD